MPVFTSLVEQLVEVKNATVNRQPSAKLMQVQNAAAGMSEGAGKDGGFLIEAGHSQKLLDQILTRSIFAQRCLRIAPDRKEKSQFIGPKINESSRASGSRHGGIEAKWIPEAGQITPGKLQYDQIKAPLKKLAAVVRASDELSQDMAGFEYYINKTVGEEFAFTLDNAILRGNGVSELLGVLNAPALITVDAVMGQTTKTILLENVLAMLSRLDARSYPSTAWYCNVNCLPQLYSMTQAIGTAGGPVVSIGDFGGTGSFRIAGLPVVVTEYSSSVGAVGDLVLADFSQYLLRMQPMSTVVSIHVYYLTNEDAYRFILRVAGLPLLSGPITPLYAAAGVTASNFVALAAR